MVLRHSTLQDLLMKKEEQKTVSSRNQTCVCKNKLWVQGTEDTWKIYTRGLPEIRTVSPIFWGVRRWKNVKESTGRQGFETMNIASAIWIKNRCTTRCTHFTIANKLCRSCCKFSRIKTWISFTQNSVKRSRREVFWKKIVIYYIIR